MRGLHSLSLCNQDFEQCKSKLKHTCHTIVKFYNHFKLFYHTTLFQVILLFPQVVQNICNNFEIFVKLTEKYLNYLKVIIRSESILIFDGLKCR